MRNRKKEYSILRGTQTVFSFCSDGSLNDCEFYYKGKKELIKEIRSSFIKGYCDYSYIAGTDPKSEKKDIKYVRKTRKALKIMAKAMFHVCKYAY